MYFISFAKIKTILLKKQLDKLNLQIIYFFI